MGSRAAPIPGRQSPACGAFASCIEEDSNLHPAIPDQTLNRLSRVSDPSGSRQIVRLVQERTIWTHRTIWVLPWRGRPIGRGHKANRLVSDRRGDARSRTDAAHGLDACVHPTLSPALLDTRAALS
jgi:hypothetical protein